MSNAILSLDHLRELAVFYVGAGTSDGAKITRRLKEVDDLVKVFASANNASHAARYKGGFPEDRTGIEEIPPATIDQVQNPRVTDRRDILSMFECLDYNCCEAEGYDSSEVLRIIEVGKSKALTPPLPWKGNPVWFYDDENYSHKGGS